MIGRRWVSIAGRKIKSASGTPTAATLLLAALLVIGGAVIPSAGFADQGAAIAVEAGEQAKLSSMGISAEGEGAILSFKLSGATAHSIEMGAGGTDAVLVLENAELDSMSPSVAVGDGLIDKVEFAQSGGSARVAMKFEQPVKLSALERDGGIDVTVVPLADGKAPAAVEAKADTSKGELTVAVVDGAVEFTLGKAPLDVNAFKLSDGVRLVVDFTGVELPQAQYIQEFKEGPVAKVAMRQSGDSVRCVVEARKAGLFEGFEVKKTSGGFAVLSDELAGSADNAGTAIASKPAVAPKAQVKAPAVAAEPVRATKPAAPAEGTIEVSFPDEPTRQVVVAAAKTSNDAARGGRISDFGFRQDPDKSFVDIGISKPASYEVSEQTDKRVVIDIKDTKLPKKYERALDASAFNGPVGLIAAYARGPHVRIIVDLKQAAPFKIEKGDEGIVVAFEGGSNVVEAPIEEPEEIEKVLYVDEKGEAVRVPMSLAEQTQSSAMGDGSVISADGKKRYTGAPISINVTGADIRNVLRLIGEVAGINIVAGSEVTGTITLRVVNVPWDQVLDVILKAKGLDKEVEGNVMRVVSSEVLSAERAAIRAEKEAEIKTKEEQTPLESDILPVNYATAEDLRPNIENVLSKRGSMSVDSRTNTILIRDLPENIELARRMLKSLDTPTPQVLIEARIVEVSSSYSKDLGVQWGGSFTADSAHGNAPGNGFPNSVGISGDTGLNNYAVNLPAAAAQGGGPGAALALSLGSINDVLSLDLRLSALETSGRGRVVSSPRVSTLDNKPAEISQGIEIPFTTATEEKIETESIDYLLKLLVTPHVTSDDSIVMKIELSKDAPSTTFFAIDSLTPAKETRYASTEVLVKDGETTVIGGIITDSVSELESGIPWFHKIPFLGWMFKSKNSNVDKTELIIFITPRILRLDQASRSL